MYEKQLEPSTIATRSGLTAACKFSSFFNGANYVVKRALPILLVLWFSACNSVYYSIWEKLGKEKRDLLKSNVDSVQDEQQNVQTQFESALDRLKNAYGTGGGHVEEIYTIVKADYERSEDRAERLSIRIKKVEEIGRDLFDEWHDEIEVMNSPELKRKSAVKLRNTQQKFELLTAQMRRSENSTKPVLVKLKDQMLYLKHSLNSQAIGRLEGSEIEEIERSIAHLTKEMRESVARADDFIGEL